MTLRKAIIQNLHTHEQIDVMYNPVEYTSATRLVTSRVGATVQFARVESPSFTVSLFFDTYEKGTDVRVATKRISSLQRPTVGAKAKSNPPVCLFSWGEFNYTGLVRNVEQRFTMFLPSGIPVRADVTVTFEQILTPRQANADAGLDNCRKMHVVTQGDRLDLIAHRELGDASAWPRIASLNAIDDPLVFPTKDQIGTLLVIPDHDDGPDVNADAPTGRLGRARKSWA